MKRICPKEKRSLTELLSSMAEQSVPNVKDLQDVLSLLCKFYSGSKRRHLIIFDNCIRSTATCLRDGQGGSALLTELEYHLGRCVREHPEVFKKLVVRSMDILKWPLQKYPSGAVAIGLKPSPARFELDTLLHCTISKLPIDNQVRKDILNIYLGDVWWGCCACVLENKCSLLWEKGLRRYTIIIKKENLKYWHQLIPFKCTHFFFSCGNDHESFIEWISSGIVSITTKIIWTFVKFLRIIRSRTKKATYVLNIGGFRGCLDIRVLSQQCFRVQSYAQMFTLLLFF